MFKDISCALNSTVVSQDNRGHGPWTIYARALMELKRQDGDYAMRSALFMPDIPGAQLKTNGKYETNPWGGKNSAQLERFLPTSSSETFELYTPMNLIDCLNFKNSDSQCLPSGVEMVCTTLMGVCRRERQLDVFQVLQFEEGDGSLILTADTANKKYKVEIVEMELDLRLLRMAPSVLGQYELSLAKQPFQVMILCFEQC